MTARVEAMAEQAAERARGRVAAALVEALPGAEVRVVDAGIAVSGRGLTHRWATGVRWLGGMIR